MALVREAPAGSRMTKEGADSSTKPRHSGHEMWSHLTVSVSPRQFSVAISGQAFGPIVKGRDVIMRWCLRVVSGSAQTR